MKKIVVNGMWDFESELEDCYTIIEAFREAGYEICLEQAQIMWQRRSLDFDAGWLVLPREDKNIVEYLKDYFEVMDEG